LDSYLYLIFIEMHLPRTFAASVAAISTTAIAAKHPSQDAVTAIAITKTVNAFSFAVDARPISTFEDIFTQDAELNLTITGSQKRGLEAINNYFAELLPPYQTQHNFGTQRIDINEDGRSATAITSFTGMFWGAENGSPVYGLYFQQYNDTLVEINGKWLISKKTVSFMVSSGAKRLFSANVEADIVLDTATWQHDFMVISCFSLYKVGNAVIWKRKEGLVGARKVRQGEERSMTLVGKS
jgi:ketosteroid isomerase-like protein